MADRLEIPALPGKMFLSFTSLVQRRCHPILLCGFG
jgi:hypothetical protein